MQQPPFYETKKTSRPTEFVYSRLVVDSVAAIDGEGEYLVSKVYDITWIPYVQWISVLNYYDGIY